MAALTFTAAKMMSRCRRTPQNVGLLWYATKAEKRKGLDRKMGPKMVDPNTQSLAARGFLRATKEYCPPANLHVKFDQLTQDIVGSSEKATQIPEDLRFKLFTTCAKEFGREIPNGELYGIETIGDLKQFYETPVDTRTPLDRLKTMKLPENLHVQHEYLRFHPETDTKFEGVTAYPGRSTIVTGLKNRGRYKGHYQKPKL